MVAALGGCGGVPVFAAAGPAEEHRDPAGLIAAQREFQRRLHALSDDSGSCISLGAWAAQQGLIDDADALYRRFLQRRPLHDDVYQALVTLSDDRPLGDDSAASRETRGLLPRRFTELRSERFIVFSDTDRQWTQQQAKHLEQAWMQFREFTDRLDLRPLPLRHRLVCVLFDDREAYQEFARLHDGVADPTIAGYYAPRSDRIVFYNPRDNPSVSRAERELRELESMLHRLKSGVSGDDGVLAQDGSVRDALASYEHKYREQAQRVALFIDQTSVATTVHEAVHHLMFATGVQSPSVQYPIWISEGLATSFETDCPDQEFGPGRECGRRRDTFTRLLEAGELLPLETLVQLTMLPSRGDDTAKMVYHQSYALVTWMSQFRRSELRTYLDSMRLRRPGRPSPREHRRIFESAFGEIDALEDAWLTHEREAR